MSNPKKTHELIRQNEQIVKKSQKHDANLQKNSTLYFQIGLIVCLLAAFGLLEMKFETTITDYGDDLPQLEEPVYADVILIKPVEPTFDEPIEQQKPNDPTDFEVVDNDTPDLPFKDVPKKESSDDVNPPMNPGDLNVIEEPEEVFVDFIRIEQVPIFPGCEKKKTNADKRECMSEKITKLVQRKFNTNLASDLGLSGRQVIQTQFKIDKTGNVSEIKTRATHPRLEKEAERVINKIPEMEPGKQRNEPVGVVYTLPIVFQVH